MALDPLFRQLPTPLTERVRTLSGSPTSSISRHVLYLPRTCLRAHTNPALELALHAASALGLPLICLAVLEDSHPASARPRRPPTDRAAAFRLEALRELQPQLAARGSCLWVHIERDGCRQAVGMSLAAKAALVVAEEHFGVEPHASAIGRIARTGAHVWLCDCHCTVPARLVPPSAMRGGNRSFLDATAKMRAERMRIDWFPPPAPSPPVAPPPPPEWSVDLGVAGALEAVLRAPSRRDTSVRPVAQTRGGARAAASRWAKYVADGGVRSYAAHRNNPLASPGKGASRISAYVNLGMLDPYRVARDAAGSPKFLEEFVGFRESPYVWCAMNAGGYARAAVAVPSWAQLQLADAADGPAPSIADLEHGRTGDALWDECQRSLHEGGELHNNLRMAWGKAVTAWWAAALPDGKPPASIAPRERLQFALDLLLRLNDDFALDGGAPPSYGGVLWCLGWRDRPGPKGRPKSRPTSVMASKIRPGDLLEQLARREAQGATLSWASGSGAAAKTETGRPTQIATAIEPAEELESPLTKRPKRSPSPTTVTPEGRSQRGSHAVPLAAQQTSILSHFRAVDV